MNMNYKSTIANEMTALIWDIKRYWYGAIGFFLSRTLVLTGVFFWTINSVKEEYHFNYFDKLLIGYVLWLFGTLSYCSILHLVRVTGSNGFIQQLSITPIALCNIILARAIPHLLYSIILISSLLVIAMLIMDHWWQINPVFLLTLLVLGVPSIWGIGFVICGLSLQTNRLCIFVINFILNLCLLFALLSDAPTSGAWSLLPFAPVIALISDIFLGGADLEIGQLFFVILNSLVYFLLGMAVYLYLENRARLNNSIGKY